MRKIPTLFKRDENNRKHVTSEANPECHWVLDGDGVATRKYDGTSCLVKDGKFFRRYEVKKGKTPPADLSRRVTSTRKRASSRGCRSAGMTPPTSSIVRLGTRGTSPKAPRHLTAHTSWSGRRFKGTRRATRRTS
jgi:hypothetical protein